MVILMIMAIIMVVMVTMVAMVTMVFPVFLVLVVSRVVVFVVIMVAVVTLISFVAFLLLLLFQVFFHLRVFKSLIYRCVFSVKVNATMHGIKSFQSREKVKVKFRSVVSLKSSKSVFIVQLLNDSALQEGEDAAEKKGQVAIGICIALQFVA